MKRKLVILTACVAVCFAGFASEEKDATLGDLYTLDTCIVSGERLDAMGDPLVIKHKGREVRFCCKSCVNKFEKNPEEYLKKIDKKSIEQQTKLYPLDTCVVLGGKLGGMGKAIDYMHKNRLVRFCCANCVKKFDADPAKYLAKIDAAAIKKQLKDYPLKTCVVMEDSELDDAKAKNLVVNNRLVRFCCNGCVSDFQKDPLKYLSKLDKASEGPKKKE